MFDLSRDGVGAIAQAVLSGRKFIIYEIDHSVLTECIDLGIFKNLRYYEHYLVVSDRSDFVGKVLSHNGFFLGPIKPSGELVEYDFRSVIVLNGFDYDYVSEKIPFISRIPRSDVFCSPRCFDVGHVRFEVASACFLDCAECAHGGMRQETKNYQMSLDQLEKFIEFSERSNYVIGRVDIHGPGEPLLWKHFNEGVVLLRRSRSVKSIRITTNAIALDKITDEAWDALDEVDVSLYGHEYRVKLKRHLLKHVHKIKVNWVETFLPRLRMEDAPLQIPCVCTCNGPMVFGNFVFLYCGPPVFDAARLLGVNIWDLKHLYVELGENYLSSFDPSRRSNMDVCRYCFANGYYHDKSVPVGYKKSGGGWK